LPARGPARAGSAGPGASAPLYACRVPAPEADTLATDLAGLRLRNPVMLAAGTHGTLDEFGTVCPLERVGALVTKSITPEPRLGNPTWRLIPARAGMLNAIGLANPGIERFAPYLAERAGDIPTVVIGSAAGFSLGDYVRVVSAYDELADRGVPAVELNVSCPNVSTGCEFGHTPGGMRELMDAVRPAGPRLKMFVKLSPGGADIVGVARAAVDGGADGLTIGNTIPAMAIDVRTRRPRLANVTGGFSGPGLHPVAVRLVHEVWRRVARAAGVPVIGAGGVCTWQDAAEMILAGASAVQLGTVLLADPRAPLRIVRGLERWAARQGVARLGELVGAVRVDGPND